VQDLDRPRADIGDLGQAGEFQRVKDLRFGLQCFPSHDGRRDWRALAAPVRRDEPDVFGVATGQLVECAPVNGMRPAHFSGLPPGQPLLVASQ
jgi:hypothetical protein